MAAKFVRHPGRHVEEDCVNTNFRNKFQKGNLKNTVLCCEFLIKWLSAI